MSHSSVEDGSSSRSGERTPLRSLDNEVLHLSTCSSRLRSKLSGDTVKASRADVHLWDTPTPRLGSSAFTKGTAVIPTSTDTTQTVCRLGDVTFRSFVCSGNEVEIPASSDCEGQSLIVPVDGTSFTAEVEDDTAASPSRMEQSCGEHLEHPYSNPAVDPPALCDPAGDSDDEQRFTCKSFACDGGEVEVSDSTGSREETIPLPRDELWDPLQDDGTISADCTQLSPLEHVDHLYCLSENDPASTSQGSENAAEGLADLTLKPFNCTGGEVEISEDAGPAHETIPLVYAGFGCSSYNYTMDASLWATASYGGLEISKDHQEHPYCDVKSDSSSLAENPDPVPDPPPCSAEAEEGKRRNSMALTDQDENAGVSSISVAVGNAGDSEEAQLSENISHPSEDQSGNASMVPSPEENPAGGESEPANSRLEDGETVSDTRPPPRTESPPTDASLQAVGDGWDAEHPEGTPSPSAVHRTTDASGCRRLAAPAEAPLQEEVQQGLDHVSLSVSQPPESSDVKDSALGSLGPVLCDSAEKAAEASPDVLKALSECPSIASALQLLSPVVKRASLSLFKLPTGPDKDGFLAEDSTLEGERNLVDVEPAGLFAGQLESPMPRPLFNSTVVGMKSQEELSREKPRPEAAPLVFEGHLQQQLRQMAEFLITACGKMGSTSAPPPAAFSPPAGRAAPAEARSVCVGTSPVKLMDHSLNTSGIFVRKRTFSVADCCTSTDPLVWNLSPCSLEGFPRQELEQRLMSSMIMVEALVQQLAAARAQGPHSSGPAPSDLREKLVQTDHTELSQTTMYRELYLEALSRIKELELDGCSRQTLVQSMQDMTATISSLSSDTDAALSNVKKMGETIREDHLSLVSHYERIKSLVEKSKETQTRSLEKVKEVLHQRNQMKTQMEEAFASKEAAFSAMDQLRAHCGSEISALEKCVGSQQELLAALNQAYPDQVALNETCHQRLNSVSNILSQTMEEHSSLLTELCTVRGLLQKTAPMLVQLNQKAAAALRERDEHCSARERAEEEREQIEEELNETNLNLQTATQQISDLNLQITVLASEIGVLQQKLTDKDEEAAQLERKVTELSATISSSLASYTFLKQALDAETTKLQDSWKDLHQANERADQLTASLEESEQRVCELSRALAQSDERLGQLQNLTQSQSVQIQQLQDVCTQLGGVQEMNEFLQMENELVREQVAESEQTLRTNLHALRERNVQCEDLKGEVSKLLVENQRLREELETTRSAADGARMELQESRDQAVREISVVCRTLQALTNELQASLSDQRQDQRKSEESAALANAEPRQSSSSFVNSVILALTAEEQEDVRTDSPCDAPEPQGLLSETSAFSRVAARIPKQKSNTVQDEERERRSVAELLSGLGGTATELINTLNLVLQRREAQLQELHNTICALQVEQQTSNSRHQAEVLELQQELRRLNSLVERGNTALQHKAQDKKTLNKLFADIQEAQEILSKHKSDNNELRKEVAGLRHALQQTTAESQFLREELRRGAGPSTVPMQQVEEKIQLLKEVERLKAGLLEAEQAKVKLVSRAKRHQIIHQTNLQKTENELQILNHMINKVRETLLSVPEVVKRCEQLQQLVDYLG
uniref:Sperm associated antigen 5 n=1 Tax=Fundulus heteroclitus TaxID=8078 RepID=A0A3Q2PVC1_FUNHE